LTKNGFGYILGQFYTNASGHPAPGLPNSTFSDQKSPFGYILEGLGIYHFCVQLEYFTTIWYLQPFGIFCGHLVNSSPFWYNVARKIWCGNNGQGNPVDNLYSKRVKSTLTVHKQKHLHLYRINGRSRLGSSGTDPIRVGRSISRSFLSETENWWEKYGVQK
jgi:hypothetical protein